MKSNILLLGAGLTALGPGCKQTDNEGANKSKPNIIVILADDMGYSDLGCYGSEIKTPNLDQLAEKGTRLTRFYNSSRCCPTRASLLTGLYQHNTGMGWMTAADLNHQGYTGDLNNQCATIPELLRSAGYMNYMAGKWHVTSEKYTGKDGPKHNWPIQRGFDKFFGTLKGGGNYFDPPSLAVDNHHVETPDNFYYTDAISDTSVQYIHGHVAVTPDQPFFMYVAYTAPHWPLHAKPEDIEKYRGKYMEGWDSTRVKRFDRMVELGILDSSVTLPPRDPDVAAWDTYTAEEKKWWDLRMAIYAAQIDCMDQGIGRIMNALDSTGILDNTLVIFLSDNGADSESIPDLAKSKKWEDMGTGKSFESYRKPWANVSSTPLKLYKKFEHEGGIATPFIMYWAGKTKASHINTTQVAHVIDFMPTFLEIAGVEYPATFKGDTLHPLPGKSLLSFINGEEFTRGPLFWEHEAKRAVLDGDWKLVALAGDPPSYEGEWELYNLADDRTETHDLAGKYPDKVEELNALWDTWASENKVLPLDGRDWHPRLHPGK